MRAKEDWNRWLFMLDYMNENPDWYWDENQIQYVQGIASKFGIAEGKKEKFVRKIIEVESVETGEFQYLTNVEVAEMFGITARHANKLAREKREFRGYYLQYTGGFRYVAPISEK